MGLIEMNPEDLKFEIETEEAGQGPRFKVIGVGGGGSSAVARMMGEGLEGVDFCVMNTDLQALRASPAPCKVQLGARLLQGLGTGGDPEIGKQAALEDTERIVECIGKASMVFITAGLGGGTGTGAAPVVASLAKELGALTVAIVTKPFAFEGPLCLQRAEKGLAKLAATVDTVIAIPNERLLGLLPRGTTFMQALKAADDVLLQAVQGISDIIVTPGLINRDFSNIRATMAGSGFAVMGTAVATGEDAAVAAARQAISCPLLDEGGIAGSGGLLINITGSSKLGLHEVSEACTLIREATGRSDVQLTFGVVLNESMGESVKVTVIATGFNRRSSPPEEDAVPAAKPEPPSEPQADAPPEEVSEEDDIETPAYLRRDRLLF
ncbi:MAG: cell division protein FtsZ [Bryobacteraceae bacterium]|nr:cell division protein FtsZ [Bryobacteraceae bacterium]